MKKPVLGITMGDPGSIGPEITLKMLLQKKLKEKYNFLIIGSIGRLEEVSEKLGYDFIFRSSSGLKFDNDFETINVYDTELPYSPEWGIVSKENGYCSIKYIDQSIYLIKNELIDAIVTNAIHKKSIEYHVKHFSGHTGYIGQFFGNPDPMMVLVANNLRVAHATTHIPLKDVSNHLSTRLIVDRLKMIYENGYLFGFSMPTIAVAALNPHAGDRGLFGDEEQRIINPSIDIFNQSFRPIPRIEHAKSADTVFSQGLGGKYDFILAMYHDQGHIPVKLSGFKWDKKINDWGDVLGVNVTIGLPIIRTSVDHGVAFGKAGKGLASPLSLINAVELAGKMVKNKNEKKGMKNE